MVQHRKKDYISLQYDSECGESLMSDGGEKIAVALASAVKEKGGTAYYVGGYVRDELMQMENKDIDLEIHGIECTELEEILDSFGERIEIGNSFGIYNLKGHSVDIAMPRQERAVGRGHKDFKVDVAPFIGTEKAARRRDFTVNAIMKNVLTGEIIDHFGGVEDLEKGIIRHVNSQSFAEDPLRVLRGAQFAARFEFEIAEETVHLCKTMDLMQLSKERVFDEMKKALLKAERPSLFFENLRKMDALGFWFLEVERTIGVEQNKNAHKEGDVWNHTMMVLDEAAKRREKTLKPLWFMISALCHDFGKIVTTKERDGNFYSTDHDIGGVPLAKDFLQRITSEKNLIKYVLNLTELHMRPNQLAGNKAPVFETNSLFDSAVVPIDLIQLALADKAGKLPSPSTFENECFLLDRLEVFNEYMSRPCVEGKDLIDAKIEQGKNYKKLLEYAHRLHLAGEPKEEALKKTIDLSKKI